MHFRKTLIATAVALALSAIPADAQHRGNGRGGARGAVPRGGAPRLSPRGLDVYRGGYGARGFGYVLTAPYYAFRPRLSLGFGLFVGYPVTYPYWAFPNPYIYGYGYPYDYPYADPYGYAYPYAYPYAYSNPYPNPYLPTSPSPSAAGPAPGRGPEVQIQGQTLPQAQYGGLSFQIAPGNAGVYVDNVYVGIVSQFTATTQPMTLVAGRHHIEIQLDGYQSITFDVNIAPGQVIPYEGRMQAR